MVRRDSAAECDMGVRAPQTLTGPHSKIFLMRRTLALLLFAAALPAWSAQPVRAKRGMVVTRERHATDAGIKVLEAGGNAVDAAVAVGFALAVTHPSARNIDLDAAGKPTQDSVLGYRAAGVPGSVRGFEYASQHYGKLKWAELVAPAVELAAKGFPLSYAQAQGLHSRGLDQFPESRRVFQRDGNFYQPGELFVQADLARTLERIERQGAKDFYEGETARLLAQDMKEHGGLITLDDLKAYKAIERKPLTGSYRGYQIVTAPLPSSGGIGILQMLAMLEPTGFEKGGAGSASSVHFMVEAMRRYFADRAAYLGDGDFGKVPVEPMLDPAYIAKLRASIDPERATPSSEVRAGKFAGYESYETTHYSVADGDGNIAIVTYTLNGGYGSKVTARGLGFQIGR